MFHHSKFRPTKYDKCVSWYDCNQGISLQSGNRVSSWTEQSGHNYMAVAISDNSMPIYNTNILNGWPAITFNGSSCFYLYDSLNIFNGLSSVTFFVVMSTNSPTSSQSIYFASVSDTSSSVCRFEIMLNDSFTHTNGYEISARRTSGNDLLLYLPSFTTLNTFPKIISIVVNYAPSTTTSIYENKKEIASRFNFGTSGLINNANSLMMCIGCRNWNANTWFIGNLHELIIYSTALSNVQRHSVENYLSTKYNIAVS